MSKGPKTYRLKGGKMRTPKGTARYAYISKPDDSTFGKDQYRLTLVFDKKDPEFKAFAKKLQALAKLHAAEMGKSKCDLPIKLVDEKMSKGKEGSGGTGDPVGAPYIELKSYSTTKDGKDIVIPTFNAKGQEEALQVYGGDIVRAEAAFVGWEMTGDIGLKGYLNAVQQLQSNWSGGTGSTFEAEEEYISDDETTSELVDELDEETDEAPFADESADDEDGDDDPLADLV